MPEHTSQDAGRSKETRVEAPREIQKKEAIEKKAPFVAPSQISQVVPYLQRMQQQGPASFQQAIHALHHTYGNQFTGQVVQKMAGGGGEGEAVLGKVKNQSKEQLEVPGKLQTKKNNHILAGIGVKSPAKNMIHRAPPQSEEGSTQEEKDFAATQKTELKKYRDAAVNAGSRLDSDTEASTANITEIEDAFTKFEEAYQTALTEFNNNIAEAKKDADFWKSVWDTIVGTTFGMATGGFFKMVEGLNLYATFVTNIAKGKATGAALAPFNPFSSAGLVPVTGGGTQNWKGLFSTTKTVLTNYMKSNKSLREISKECNSLIDWLDVLSAGGPKSQLDGGVASVRANMKSQVRDFVTEGQQGIPQLDNISNSAMTSMTSNVKTMMTSAIAGKTVRSIQQDIAIRWIASLTPNQLDAIDADPMDSHLKSLGVIGGDGSRLLHDAGDWTSPADQKIIALQAQVENEIMGQVGNQLAWHGGTIQNNSVVGMVANSEGKTYRAIGPTSLKTELGGSALVTSYSKPTTAPEDPTSLGGLGYQGTSDSKYKGLYRAKYLLHVQPTESSRVEKTEEGPSMITTLYPPEHSMEDLGLGGIGE